MLGLERYLEIQYASGRIWYEADVQQATVAFLSRQLLADSERWMLGSQHLVGRFRPDIVCYYRPNDYTTFLARPEASVVGVVEIKFASALGRDLEKLERMQQRCKCVGWMVYGDHFSAKIHQGWARQQQRRATKIAEWCAADKNRGSTLLKCAQIAPSGICESHAPILSALNSQDHFWIKD